MHSDGGDDDATAYRCERCGKECMPYWRGVDIEDEWPAASEVMFARPVEDSWFRENAERIAAECALLVYDAPDVGVLLGVDEAEPGDIALHWLPLFRMRGRRENNRLRAQRG